MRHITLFTIIVLATFSTAAQEMSVKSMDMDPMDFTADTNQRLDLNGVPCAIVKVQMPRGAAFEGNIFGDVVYRTGEYWVYMTANSKMLRVKHESAKPLMVNFEEPLVAKATYVLDIMMPAKVAPQNNENMIYAEADREYRNENYVLAMELYKQLPDNIDALTNVGFMYWVGKGVDKDGDEAVKWFRKAAERGDARAQLSLGLMYDSGEDGVSQDYTEAVKWYRMAAEQGDADGQRYLGDMYDSGNGVKQDYMEAVKWYQLAADQGNADAQCSLGIMYYKGHGVSQDYTEAFKLFLKGASQDDPYSQDWLGVCYYHGYGVTADKQKAYKWFKKAADQGHEDALKFINEHPDITQPQRTEDEILAEANKEYDNNQNYARALELYKQAPGQAWVKARIGYMYHVGQGVSLNYDEAANWYRKAAEQGYALAQYNLGCMYENGHGVSLNNTEAVNWYRKAAEQGYADAQCNLGTKYYYGQGVRQNYAEAVNWYRKAAEQGSASAQHNLGYMYENGQRVGQNYAEAVNWYRKAAEQEYAPAQCNLGIMYYYGNGIGLDKQEAYKWLKKAADQGNEPAVKFINEHTF